MSSRPAHAHVSMDKLTTTLTRSPVSPVTSGDAVAQTTSIEMDAPFLKGTVLKKGAKGATFQALQSRLHLLYLEGFIPISPYEPYNEYELLGGIYAHRTWECVKVYIDQGISYKFKNPAPFLKRRSQNGNYNVDDWVWESLDLPIASTWEDMFGSINTSGKTIRMKLKGNTATLTWYPKFEIYRYNSATGKDEKISPRYIYPEDQQYLDILKDCLDGVLRWPSSHANNIGGQVNIQGVSGEVKVEIKDYYGKTYDPSKPVKDYYFHTPKGGTPNVTIKLTKDKDSAMVPVSLIWSNSYNLNVNINHPLVNVGNSNNVQIDRIMEHEFGHVIGLFDAYGYEDKPDDPNHCYGGHGPQGVVLPPAYIDGTDIKWTSVMVCNYWSKDTTTWKSIQPQSVFTRTALDYEMILFAWRDNQLQCYVPGFFGVETQAYFH